MRRQSHLVNPLVELSCVSSKPFESNVTEVLVFITQHYYGNKYQIQAMSAFIILFRHSFSLSSLQNRKLFAVKEIKSMMMVMMLMLMVAMRWWRWCIIILTTLSDLSQSSRQPHGMETVIVSTLPIRELRLRSMRSEPKVTWLVHVSVPWALNTAVSTESMLKRVLGK